MPENVIPSVDGQANESNRRLDYARPSIPFDLGRLPLNPTMSQWLRWTIFRRPIRNIEITLVLWLGSGLAYAMLAVSSRTSPDLVFIFGIPLFVTMLVGIAWLVLLAKRLLMATIAMVVTITVPSVALTGMFQYETCPHATYVQHPAGIFVADGKACGNTRKLGIWWLRHG